MDNLKNIVVLKNLPSNIIDEAFVILKPNQKVEVPSTKTGNGTNGNSKDYIVKEAEMVISSYLKGSDNSLKKELSIVKRKYKRLKTVNVLFIPIAILTILVSIFI